MKKNCRTNLHLRNSWPFLLFNNDNLRHYSALPVTEQLEIIWLLIALEPERATAPSQLLSGEICRQVCTGALDFKLMFVGAGENPVHELEFSFP